MHSFLLFCVGGMIAIGKSYYCKSFISANPNLSILYINFDEWYDFFVNTTSFQKEQWKPMQELLKQFISSLADQSYLKNEQFVTFYSNHVFHSTASKQLIILIEDNFYYKSMRRDFWDLAKQLQIPYCQFLFLPNSLQECLLNNSKREKPIPEPIIKEMFEKFEYDSTEYTFSKQSTIHSVEQLHSIWNHLLSNAILFSKIEDSISETTIPSKEHELDISTRKLMSWYLQNYPHLKPFAKEINQLRRNHLSQFESLLQKNYLH